jgi:hypothetical protein
MEVSFGYLDNHNIDAEFPIQASFADGIARPFSPDYFRVC